MSTNLLATCRKVHKEALSVLYGLNKFKFGQITSLIAFSQPMYKDLLVEQVRGHGLAGVQRLRRSNQAFFEIPAWRQLESLQS